MRQPECVRIELRGYHSAIQIVALPQDCRGWKVYILQCGDGTLYTGITNNLVKRLQAHSDGSGAKYTRSRLPVALVYQEEVCTRAEASRREVEIKRLSRKEKCRLIKKRLEGKG